MDHYKALGLNRNASKDEIKEAFRKLAMRFHPDKHSHSPKPVRDGSTLRFKQVSEAYEVLMDDRKRADYNIRSTGCGSSSSGYGYGYTTRSGPKSGHGYGYGYGDYRRAGNGDGLVSKFEIALRFLTTRGTVIIDTSRDALWKMQNPGKSFEDAVKSVEKAKAVKDKM